MPGKAKITEIDDDLEERMQQLEDEQLKTVLRKRKLYQEKAANAAINEALKREIIASEEDLMGPEYRTEPLKPRVFPLIESPRNKNRIRRSLSRGFLLSGLLPAIWGIVRFNAGLWIEGSLLVLFGLLWMTLSALLYRRYSIIIVRTMLAFAGLSVGYIIRWIIMIPRINFMDLFIIVVLYALLAYGLLFILRLKD